MNSKEFLTLYEFNLLIQKVIKNNFDDEVFLIAEVSRITYNAAGYVNIELIEKKDEEIIAKNKAVIWSDKKFILGVFETILGEKLSVGMKILAKIRLSYHPSYGVTLNILNIDPSYTIGEMQLKKNQIIDRLEKEGALELNKNCAFPLVPQKIALITSKTAAGYEDFVNHLINNEKSYFFNVKLFPSVMQGKDVENSILKSLDAIIEDEGFEVVVIVRGGGSVGELDCFNNYNLAKKISQLTIPALVGIGHDRDKTVLDYVAYESFKTPTAVAHFLINKVDDFENEIKNVLHSISRVSSEKIDSELKMIERIASKVKEGCLESLKESRSDINAIGNRIFPELLNRLNQEKRSTDKICFNIFSIFKDKLKTEHSYFDKIEYNVKNIAWNTLQKNSSIIEKIEKEIMLQDPDEILKKGFSITNYNGKSIKNFEDVPVGATIVTHLLNFDIYSVVERKVKKQ
ncbi:exodeoxyribonuclease VII large subunit [Thermodesulfobium sp. 4217-1]|uniref:exodeoxyribonuclease VII large subunit n=1 Tax=Thermodesulfobium sp. 4217-1 TaxID=3120013 RepID=UPI003221A45F